MYNIKKWTAFVSTSIVAASHSAIAEVTPVGAQRIRLEDLQHQREQ